jgi:hypothetical protein
LHVGLWGEGLKSGIKYNAVLVAERLLQAVVAEANWSVVAEPWLRNRKQCWLLSRICLAVVAEAKQGLVAEPFQKKENTANTCPRIPLRSNAYRPPHSQ